MHAHELPRPPKRSLLRRFTNAVDQLLGIGNVLAQHAATEHASGSTVARWIAAKDATKRLLDEARREEEAAGQLPLVSGRELELAQRVQVLEAAIKDVLADPTQAAKLAALLAPAPAPRVTS